MPVQTPSASTYTEVKRLTTQASAAVAVAGIPSKGKAPPPGGSGGSSSAGARIPVLIIPGITRPPPTVVATLPTSLLIVKKSYPSMDTTGSFDFYKGGTVSVQASSRFTDYRWGIHSLFDGIRTEHDWATDVTGQPPYLIVTFPVPVYVAKIFLITRAQGTNLAPNVTVLADGVVKATATKTIVTNALGLDFPAYVGDGLFLEPKAVGTVWRFNFPVFDVMCTGEIEFHGYAA